MAAWKDGRKEKNIDFRKRKKHQFVVPLIYAFIDWFLYVPWLGMEPATLAYPDDAVTNEATQPGPYLHFL